MRNRSNPRGRASYVAESLEPRITLSIFTVSTTLDNGAGSLRQAILDADAAMGSNQIQFAALFSSSPHTITFTSATPQINGQLTITGPGASLLTVTRSGTVTASSNVFNSFASALTMSGMTVTGGNINANGGGLSINGVTPNVTLDSMVFTNNQANGDGGAISLTNNSSLTVRNSTISNNTATALGGGIFFFQSGSLLMQNCTVSSNATQAGSGHGGSGGGFYFVGSALASPPAGYTANTLVVQGSTFVGNTGPAGGGGIAADDFNGTVLCQNSTFNNNTAGTSGGGLWCVGTTATVGSITLQDCTVASNTANSSTAGTGGGGVARVGSFAGSITLLGTIVYGNSNPAGALDIFASSFTTTNVNSCDIGSATGYTLSGTSGNNRPVGTNPMLSALASNGGSTQTMALPAGSPCIDTGTTISGITTDQRGIPRPQGSAPDIGAYERTASNGTLISMSYEYLTRQAVNFNFNGDASATFTRSSYSILNRNTNQTLPSSTGAFSFNGTGTIATLVLTSLLPNANYRVTSGAMTLDFFVLAADANQDRKVNALDFNAVASNFGRASPNYSQGDFNYDSAVNTLDFTTLATNFGATLAASAAAVSALAASPAAAPIGAATLFGGSLVKHPADESSGQMLL
jgi:predicted outer membrane repeat protein